MGEGEGHHLAIGVSRPFGLFPLRAIKSDFIYFVYFGEFAKKLGVDVPGGSWPVIACSIRNERDGMDPPVYFRGSCTCCSDGGTEDATGSKNILLVFKVLESFSYLVVGMGSLTEVGWEVLSELPKKI